MNRHFVAETFSESQLPPIDAKHGEILEPYLPRQWTHQQATAILKLKHPIHK